MAIHTEAAVILTGEDLHIARRLIARGHRLLNQHGGVLTPAEVDLITELDTAARLYQHQRHHRQYPPTYLQQSHTAPLGTEDMARIMGVSQRTIQRKAPLLGGWKEGGRWRFPEPDRRPK